jgi:hypothetical protein
MMREIKFRAWVPSEKLMFEDVRYIDNDIANGRGIGFSDRESGARFNVHPDFMMQYTGLKDKNGKEIYEGDIINQDFKYGWKNHVMALMNSMASDDMGLDMYGYPDVDGACEVIGNIYENPELLE